MVRYMMLVLIDFSLTVKAATLILNLGVVHGYFIC